jgi:hypothetical protein
MSTAAAAAAAAASSFAGARSAQARAEAVAAVMVGRAAVRLRYGPMRDAQADELLQRNEAG